MDIWSGAYKDGVVGGPDLILRLTVVGVTMLVMVFFCCYSLWKVIDNMSEADNMDRRELPGIELEYRSPGYIRTRQSSSIEDDNNIDINSDSEETASETLIDYNSNENIIIHDAIVHDGSTSVIKNDVDLICTRRRDEKNEINANTGDIFKNDEDNVGRCDSAIDRSQKCGNEDNDRGKRDVEIYTKKIDDAIEICVDSEEDIMDSLNSLVNKRSVLLNKV